MYILLFNSYKELRKTFPLTFRMFKSVFCFQAPAGPKTKQRVRGAYRISSRRDTRFDLTDRICAEHKYGLCVGCSDSKIRIIVAVNVGPFGQAMAKH